MERKKFRVEQIDHIHIFVPNPYEAAAWYQFSVYFCDPYGNPDELTTYEYQYVSDRIGRLLKNSIR